MSQDTVTLREQVILKDAPGAHDLIVRHQYTPPTADGKPEDDPFARMDMANAKWMFDVLLKEYPGHLWRTVYDGRNKMAYLSIPILMGINKYWAINLVTDYLDDKLLIRCAGDLLQRYGLRPRRFELDPFLDAREKHSALVVPTREFPD